MNPTNTPFLLAQCKAYHSIDDLSKEIETLLKIDSSKDFNIHISLPYSHIETISKKFSSSGVHFGAEMFLSADEGSFTSSIAGKLLQDMKATFVLIGTPEDRGLSSSPDQLKNKVKAALNHQIHPFVCINDSLQEHQDKRSKEVLAAQIKSCLEDLSPENLTKVSIVYNAEWISSTPWEAKSLDLEEAYSIFKEAVQEALGDFSGQLIVAIPAYSQDIAELIQNLKSVSPSFIGYSVGILSESAEYLQPLN